MLQSDSGVPDRVVCDEPARAGRPYKRTTEPLTSCSVLAFLSQARLDPEITMSAPDDAVSRSPAPVPRHEAGHERAAAGH